MGRMGDYQHVYCLFCRTGAEHGICEEIRKRFPGVYPLAATQEKHRIVNGHEEIDRRIFLSGYLFLYTNELIAFDSLLRMDDVYRILGDEGNAHELQDGDRAFAEWLLRNDGLIGISRIANRNGRIAMRSGPMKYFSKRLVKLDKHTKNALVRTEFLGTVREMWLAFEFEDEEATETGQECLALRIHPDASSGIGKSTNQDWIG